MNDPLTPDTSRAKVLIVEDEVLIGTYVQNCLRDMGYEAGPFVTSGEEAIRRTAEIQPDIILMDIMLEGEMTGIDAAEEIRVRYDVPIIFLTAYSDE